jgi:cobalt-zinc-cadmium efflux system protein
VQVEGVMEVHDLHVWALSTGKNMLTAHIDVADNCEAYKVLARVEKIVHEMGVHHSTVQICSGAA